MGRCKNIDRIICSRKIKRLYPSLRIWQIYMIQKKNQKCNTVCIYGDRQDGSTVVMDRNEKGFLHILLQIAINSTVAELKIK